jgi:hypothetical protein
MKLKSIQFLFTEDENPNNTILRALEINIPISKHDIIDLEYAVDIDVKNKTVIDTTQEAYALPIRKRRITIH